MISVLGKGILIFTVDKVKVPSIVNNGRSILVTQIQVYLLLANLPIKGCDINPHFPGGFIEGNIVTKTLKMIFCASHLNIQLKMQCHSQSRHEKFRRPIPFTVAEPGFTRGWGSNPPGGPTYDFAKFSQKLHKIERIWTPIFPRAPSPRSATDHKSQLNRL